MIHLGKNIILKHLTAIDRNYFNGRIIKCLLSDTFKSILNWIVPGLYGILIVPSIYFFIKDCYPVLQHYEIFKVNKNLNDGDSDNINITVDLRLIAIVIPTVAINVYSFVKAVFTDPGDVGELNLSKDSTVENIEKVFPYDEIIFFDYDKNNGVESRAPLENQRGTCYTCHTKKFARSKHCSTCGKCILLMDHHCIWLNNCVGYYNYRYFISFLITLQVIFVYGGYMLWSILSYALNDYKSVASQISLTGSAKGSFKDTSNYSQVLLDYFIRLNEILKKEQDDLNQGNKSIFSMFSGLFFSFIRYLKTTWFVITNSSFVNEISGILLFFCIFLSPLILVFIVEHFRYVYLGVSTNETLKWEYIKDLLGFHVLFKLEPVQRKGFPHRSNDSDKNTVYLIAQRTESDPYRFARLRDIDEIIKVETFINNKLVSVNSWEDLQNIYDDGFFNNFKNRFFPKKL